MVDTHTHPPLILSDIVDPIGDDLAQFLIHKVMSFRLNGCLLGLPVSALIFIVANQFLLLSIHRNDGLMTRLKGCDGVGNMLKLCIPVWMVFAFLGFAIRL